MRLELRMAENDNELSVKLPEGLRRQFAQVERHLWRVETAIAVCIALCGLIASYLLLFISDRIWETPIWLRVSLTVLGVGTFLGAGYRWAWKWLWQRPDLRKLAKLVQKKYRRLGDRLLGIVELANEQKHLANFSPALYHAAIHQVAAEAEKFDFRESVSPRRAKKFISAAAILFAPLLLAALILPAASWNVFLRWLAPGAAITRYTLVTLEGFPDKLIVPHGETFELTGAVQYRSFWKPSRATGQYERQQKIEDRVQAAAFAFFDDAAEVRPRRLFEASVHEVIEDRGVDLLAHIGRRRLRLDAFRSQFVRVHRSFHQVAGSENQKTVETTFDRDVRDFFSDVQPWQRRLIADQVDCLVRCVVGADQEIRARVAQLRG